MSITESIVNGLMMRQQDRTNELLEQQNMILGGNAREQVLQELRREGVILPPRTWDGKDIDAKAQAIIDAWFTRHPETKKGTGEFAKKYPHIIEAQETMFKLLNANRLKEEEFFTLFNALYNF